MRSRLRKIPLLLFALFGVASLSGVEEAEQTPARLYSGPLPADAARYVSRWPEVAYIEAAKMARPMLDVSRPAVQADVVQLGAGLPSAYRGAGADVGSV